MLMKLTPNCFDSLLKAWMGNDKEDRLGRIPSRRREDIWQGRLSVCVDPFRQALIEMSTKLIKVMSNKCISLCLFILQWEQKIK